MTKLMTATRLKVLIRKSFSGSTGSAARRSTATNAISSTTASTASPMIWADPQSQVVPPRDATRIRQVATEAMRKVPR